MKLVGFRAYRSSTMSAGISGSSARTSMTTVYIARGALPGTIPSTIRRSTSRTRTAIDTSMGDALGGAGTGSARW
jgi:hypothetical protein